MIRHWEVELTQARQRVRVLEYLLERAKRPKPERVKARWTIINQVEDLIRNNDMQTFKQLTELAKDYGIAKNSVCHALKSLAEAGRAVVKRTGKGFGRWSAVSCFAILFAGCSTTAPRQPVIVATPKPEVGWPLAIEPEPPTIAAMKAEKRTTTVSRQVQQPHRGNLVVRWDLPLVLPEGGYQIFGNDVYLLTVSNIYENCTLTGLPEGYPVTVYAIGGEDRSNVATGLPVRTPWTRLNVEPYAYRYDWRTQTGTTNVLQGSTNLTTWTNLATFRAATSNASVTLTNPPNFARVLIRNATNFSAPTVTQSVAFVKLSWQGDGTLKTLERQVDSKSRSYADVLTSNQSGLVSVIMKPDVYRVTP